jgi:hypothetical protein
MPTDNEIKLQEIDSLANRYAARRQTLAYHVRLLESEIAAVRGRNIGFIKKAAAAAADAQSDLRAAIELAPHLFVRPRTFSLHGIKVGFQKGKGKITWQDEEKVVALIKKNFTPEQAQTLIKIVEKPAKDALANLKAADLRKIGVEVEEASEQVVIKAIDSDIDKLVAAILEEGAKETS